MRCESVKYTHDDDAREMSKENRAYVPQAGLKHEVLITLHFIAEKYPLDLQNEKKENE